MVFSTTVYVAAGLYFAVLIGIELWAMRRKQEKLVLSDSLNSLMMGMGSVVMKTLVIGLELFVYNAVAQRFALFELDPAQPLVWVFAFVFGDFCFYWFHRLHHEVNVLWASHVQHHSSEEYNLTTALRQEWTAAPYEILFYVPLAVAGVPFEVFTAVLGLNLLYQFWLHSRHIPKLPRWFEGVFNTASHHRVHHAQNPIYMDRNYAGALIIWDRLFGTFQEELDAEPVVYGVTTPPKSWNPLVTVSHVYAMLWRDALQADRWSDRLTLWFRPTGWRPRNLPPYEKAAGYAPKHDHRAPEWSRRLAVAAFAAAVGVFFVYLGHTGGPFLEKLPFALAIWTAAGAAGWLLDRKRAAAEGDQKAGRQDASQPA